MKRLLFAAILCAFCAGGAFAAGEPDSWKAWYDNLYKGLRTKVTKKLESRTRVSAVAAVRGSKTGRDASALYWKGGISEKARKKCEEERKAFGDAVELVVNGEVGKGRAAVEKFMTENPESVYLPDAKEALKVLPAEAAAAEPAVPARTPAADATGK